MNIREQYKIYKIMVQFKNIREQYKIYSLLSQVVFLGWRQSNQYKVLGN